MKIKTVVEVVCIGSALLMAAEGAVVVAKGVTKIAKKSNK